MNGKQLKNSILQWAIQGRLVPQDPNDEPASVLLEKIRQEKERLIKEKKIKRDKNASIIYRGEDNSYYEKLLATGEVKCIDEEIPFEVPKGWEWCRLRDIGITETGTTPSKTHPEYFGNYIPFLGPANILEDKIISETQGLSEEGVKHGRVVSSDSVIQVCIGGSIGKCAIVKKNVTFNQQINSITPIKCCLEYVHFVLQSETFRLAIMSKATGTATPIINRGNWEQLLFPIPPFDEQNKIVAKLGELLPLVKKYSEVQDCLVELNISINDKLKKSILQEAIQGKLVPQLVEEGTAKELLVEIRKEKERLVKEGKLKKSALTDSIIFKGDDNKYYEQIGKKCLDITEQIPFEIPSNWEWCRVRNVSNSYIGLTYKPTDIDEKGTIVLRSCNIRNGKLALDDIVRVSSSISEKLLIEENDIIICARNGSKRLVGKSALIRNLTEPMTFGAFMAICKTPIYEYMFAYLQSDLFFGQLRDVSNTTTINQLTQNKFNDFLIPIPPVKEQERIAFKISQLFHELR